MTKEGYEYYMYRKGAYYFRNTEVKFKKVPDMSDQLQFDFYNAVRERGYGVRYKFVNY